mgnify:CR=1 FL=1
MIQTIDRDTLARKLTTHPQPMLIEALPATYYLDWHLPGARNLPHDGISAESAAHQIPDRHAEIIVYCANTACRNSHLAAARLLQLGYTKVSVYAGGKQEWQAANLPVEVGMAARAA